MSPFARHALLRLLWSLLAVAGAAFLLLAMIGLIPGDPATMILGSRATPETIAQLRGQMGLDLPLAERYFGFLGAALQGDLGADVFNGRPVLDLVLAALPNTAALAAASLTLAALIGGTLALISARNPGGRADTVIAFLSVGFVSAPSFVVSVLLIMVFAVKLGWFPALGVGDKGDLLDQIHHLMLPASALALGWIGYIARLLRSSLLEALAEPHIRTLRGFAVPERQILLKYALKPAIIPTLSVLGMGLGELLGGAVFAEVVFNRPGLGSLVYDAIRTRNYPLVQGGILVIVTLYVLTNLIVDLLQTRLDPRDSSRLAAGAA